MSMAIKAKLYELESLARRLPTGAPAKCRMDRLSDDELLWEERTTEPHVGRDGMVDLSRIGIADLRRMRDLAAICSNALDDAQAARFRELLTLLAPYRREDRSFDHYKLNNDEAKTWHTEFELLAKQAGSFHQE